VRQPYVQANLCQNWAGEATKIFGGDRAPLLGESTQLEFAVCLTPKISALLSFCAQAGNEFVFGDTNGGRR
jgi:hypothetical protein